MKWITPAEDGIVTDHELSSFIQSFLRENQDAGKATMLAEIFRLGQRFPTPNKSGFTLEDMETIIDSLKEFTVDPYPEDVFLPIPTNVLEMIHSTLMEEYKMPLDRLTGHIGRALRKPLAAQVTRFLNSLTQISEQGNSI